MTATLVARGVSAAHADRTLFADLAVTVAPGDVVGLVGANGAGKSTLLRILAGLDAPATGSVSLSPADATIGWLPQEVERRVGETVAGHLERRTGVAAAQLALDDAAAGLGEARPGADDAYSAAFDRWMALGAADLDERTGQVLADLGLRLDLTHPMTGLSGGQAARVGLAALLLARFDVLLLDEPTNDLDLDGLARLEAFVQGQRAGIVVVSHDREFLSRCVTGVVELDLAQQRVGVYGGGYDAYLDERATARRHAREDYDEYADKRGALEERGKMQRGWMDQGVKAAARKRKDNDKIGRGFRVEQTEKQAAKVSQTARMIERLEEVAEPRKEWELRYEIAAAPRGSAVVATLRDAVVHLGPFTLGPVNLQVDAGDRIAVTGANGAGKTTLLGALLGRVPLASGAASLGTSVAIGEVDQARALLDSTLPLADAFEAQVPAWPAAEVRTLLAKFGLKAAHVQRPARSLSPGERTRAALALLQARGVNLLVLDEPSNHLDLPAIEQLESALAGYTGTLLLVTHDRRMLDAVAVNRRWVVAAGTVREE
ncbi:ABC-F family ATP-binding cassette domain-containing protein [Pengzhenrongella sicca]|uniref:ABC-F family ATP-binding cassette domain-containing protein n=1 Tax=Pengzhenrongella sicca TaxID=2819238 RepID=A0A8A4ZL11_9MICO|nr:ABC-F family ATP-binding cassette domain-containing protein [Pengzhenrongella sicca]QTE30268.1 ABC-F family ATP-binding cassette domain-containing protein [Pengzhenrongella sicca]